jgi:uncharacterized protein
LKTGAVAALTVAMLAFPRLAIALTLDEARRQGLVGERPDGYIGAVRDASGVQALVSSVNTQRREQYERTARETGRSRSEVEAVAGRSLIERAQPGWYVMGSDGSWRQK